MFAAEDHSATPVEIVLAGLRKLPDRRRGGLSLGARKVQPRSRVGDARGRNGRSPRHPRAMDEDVRNGFDGIKVTYKIDADASPDDIKAIVAQSQKRSGRSTTSSPTRPTSPSRWRRVLRRPGRRAGCVRRCRHRRAFSKLVPAHLVNLGSCA